GVGGISVCRSCRSEPDLGARAAQPGAGRLPRVTCTAQCTVSGQGVGEFSICGGVGSADDAALRCVLRLALSWPGVATGRSRAARDLGTGGEWHVLRGALDSYPEPRDHVAAHPLPDF